MAYIKTTWTDRQVQRPLTFTMTNNDDGSVTLIPSEGIVTQTGTPICADNLNHIEEGIETLDTTTLKLTGGTIDGSLIVNGNTEIGGSVLVGNNNYLKIKDNEGVDITVAGVSDTNIGYLFSDHTKGSLYIGNSLLPKTAIRGKQINLEGSTLITGPLTTSNHNYMMDGNYLYIMSLEWQSKALGADSKGEAYIFSEHTKGTITLGSATTPMTLIRGTTIALGGNVSTTGRVNTSEDVYVGKDIYVSNKQDRERRIVFENSGTGTYSHNVKLYGGNGTSTTGMGVYDTLNGRSVWAYADTTNDLGVYPALRVYNNMYSTGSLILGTTTANTTNGVYAYMVSGRYTSILSRTSSNAIYVGTGYDTAWDTNLLLRGTVVRLYSHKANATGGSSGVFVGTSGSVAVTSDENFKESINPILGTNYEQFFDNLVPVTYKYKGEGFHRMHIGFGARATEKALLDAGLTTEDFGGIVKETNVDLPSHGDELIHYDEAYSLRYEEFIALNTMMIKKQQARIDQLEQIVAELLENK